MAQTAYRITGENGNVGALAGAGGAHADDAGLPPVVQGVRPPQVQEGRGVRHLHPRHIQFTPHSGELQGSV